MPLYVRDAEVDRLLDKLKQRDGRSKTEIVREALRQECERRELEPDLVEKTKAFVRELHARHPPTGLKADKAFIDSLYED